MRGCFKTRAEPRPSSGSPPRYRPLLPSPSLSFPKEQRDRALSDIAAVPPKLEMLEKYVSLIVGSLGPIALGATVIVLENAVLRGTARTPLTVGNNCVIGHLVHLEGCTIMDHSLVGNGSIVMHEVVVHPGAMVAANSVLLNRTIVPSGALAVGIPATIKDGKTIYGSLN